TDRAPGRGPAPVGKPPRPTGAGYRPRAAPDRRAQPDSAPRPRAAARARAGGAVRPGLAEARPAGQHAPQLWRKRPRPARAARWPRAERLRGVVCTPQSSPDAEASGYL